MLKLLWAESHRLVGVPSPDPSKISWQIAIGSAGGGLVLLLLLGRFENVDGKCLLDGEFWLVELCGLCRLHAVIASLWRIRLQENFRRELFPSPIPRIRTSIITPVRLITTASRFNTSLDAADDCIGQLFPAENVVPDLRLKIILHRFKLSELIDWLDRIHLQ